MKKLLIIIASFLGISSIAYAAQQVTVPLAPAANYVLLSTSTGLYTAVATSSLGISGGSSIPGGSNTDIQYNNSGVFGGTDYATLDSSGDAVFQGSIQGYSSLQLPNWSVDTFGDVIQNSQLTLQNGPLLLEAGGPLEMYSDGGSTLVTSLGGSGAGTASFATGAFTIDGSGNLGSLGAASFSGGNMTIDSSGNGYFAGNVMATGTLTVSATSTLTGLKLTNLASTFLAVDSSGNVISTTTPSGGGGSGNSAWTIGNQFIYNATSTDRVVIGTSTPYAKFSVQGTLGSSTPLFDVSSSTSATATSSLFTILANGNVGVGTSTPGSLLSVQGNEYLSNTLTASSTINAANFTTQNYGNTATTVFTSGSGSTGFQLVYGGNNAGLGNLAIERPDNTAMLEMSNVGVTTNGWLSIGQPYLSGVDTVFTRLAVDKLSLGTGVANNTAGTLILGTVGIGSSTPSSILTVEGSTTNATSTLFTIASSSGAVFLNVLPNGNVGIGTTTPATALDVNGNITDENIKSQACIGTDSTGKIINGTCSGTNYFSNSSATTSLTTGSILSAGIGTFGQVNGTSTATSTFVGSIISPCFATSTAGGCIVFGSGGGSGTVTSVAMTVPTGLSISGSPITTSGTLGLTLTSGYNIPLTASTTNWNNFYNASATLPYYIGVGTTSVNSITTLPNLSLPASQVTGLPSYTNYFTNVSASTTLTTGTQLIANTFVGTSTTATSSFVIASTTSLVIYPLHNTLGGTTNNIPFINGNGIVGADTSNNLTWDSGSLQLSAQKLYVNTTSNLNGAIYLSSSAGTSGQLLQSNGGATNTWVSTSSLGISGTNYFSNSGASTTLSTGSNLLAGIGTFGSLISTSTIISAATTTTAGLKLTNLSNTILAVDSSGNVIATTTSAGGMTAVNASGGLQSSGGSTPTISPASGYNIPLTASTTNWNNFYNASATLPYYIGVGTTSINSITTLPNLTLPFSQVSGTVPVNQGGTGSTSYAIGSLLLGSSTNPIYQLLGTTTGAVLVSQGAGVAPKYIATSSLGFTTGTVTSVGLSSSNSTLTIGSTPVTTSGTITADINLTNPNTWTGGQIFTNASSTNFFATSATTTTFKVTGQTTLATASSTGLTVTATSTLTGLTLKNLSNTLLGVDSNGFVIATTSGGGTNYFTNSSASTTLTTGSNLLAGLITAGSFIATSTTGTSTLAGSLSVGSSTASTTFQVDAQGHEWSGGTQPTCTTNCTMVAGDDNDMRVLSGTSVTSITITFASEWFNPASSTQPISPLCWADDESQVSTGVEASSTPTTVVLTLPTALTSKNIGVFCRGSTNLTF